MMNTQYLVTQYDKDGDYVNSALFPFKFMAVIVAWVMSGRGLNGQHYTTKIRKEKIL